MCFWFQKETENLTNSEADLPSSSKNSRKSICWLICRYNQTAHISLQIISISKSLRDKNKHEAS
ncbi:hypothetical protein OAI87_02745, partial [Paracoccaceae bacterium]|nr:hypothetical protein [Paracoccaceae bacterium]